jgi:tetratricopeptide (TPR) repeat protein
MRYTPVFVVLAAVLFCGLCIHPVLAQTSDEWANSGNQLYQQGRYLESLQAFENAISLNPGNRYAWSGKADALQSLNRLQ